MIVYIQQIRVAGWIRVVLSWYCYTWVRTDNYNKLVEEEKNIGFIYEENHKFSADDKM